MAKILLGRCKETKEPIYLTKHNWDCGWYWGFGYLGNNNCHFHFSSYLEKVIGDSLFDNPLLSDNEWWVVLDLFKQAYTLREAAATYRYGGYLSHRAGLTDTIRDEEMCTRINKDLETTLDIVWKFLEEKANV